MAPLNTTQPEQVLRALGGACQRAGRAPVAVVLELLAYPPFMPRRTVASLFRSIGTVLGVCAALGTSVYLVRPQRWQSDLFGAAPRRPRARKAPTTGKQRVGVSPRKGLFLATARKRWPRLSFPAAGGQADAAWLAVWLHGFVAPR